MRCGPLYIVVQLAAATAFNELFWEMGEMAGPAGRRRRMQFAAAGFTAGRAASNEETGPITTFTTYIRTLMLLWFFLRRLFITRGTILEFSTHVSY